MAKTRKTEPQGTETAIVTVAAIRSPKRGVTEYLFHERQQIFTTAGAAAGRGEVLRLLKGVRRDKAPIKVVLDARRGQIRAVETPTADELEAFSRTKIPTDIRGTTKAIDLDTIDPTTCSANANVSMYSIQPGSAYWPTNFQGTTFGTDPTYALTDGTLTAYKNLTTCP